MIKQKILVLGGSYLQSAFVDTAKNLNFEILILDKNPTCYLSKYEGTNFRAIDISNIDDVEKIFLDFAPNIILSPVTEIGNKISSIIAQKYGLLYNSVETVLTTTDKGRMRERLKSSKMDEPLSFKLCKDENIEDIPIEYPIIVKPTINSASRGVTLVRNRSELESAINTALEYCKSINEIIIEEFIDGDQYSIETISSNGNHFIVAIVREYISESPYFMERFDVISCEENNKLYNTAYSFVNELLNTLDISYGPCHIEVKITKDGTIRLIEIASRSGMLRDKLITAAAGCNFNELIIRSYLGQDLSPYIKLPTRNASLGLIAYEEDIITYNKASKDNQIFEYYLNGKSIVKNPRMLTDVIGYFFIGSDDMEVINRYKVKL